MGYPKPIGEGALWKKTTKSGDVMLSGNLEVPLVPGAPPMRISFLAFVNDKKGNERAPDFKVLVNTCEPAPHRAGRGDPRAMPAPDPATSQEGAEDVPF